MSEAGGPDQTEPTNPNWAMSREELEAAAKSGKLLPSHGILKDRPSAPHGDIPSIPHSARHRAEEFFQKPEPEPKAGSGQREKRGITATLRSAIGRARNVLGMNRSTPSQPESPTPPTQQPPSTPTK